MDERYKYLIENIDLNIGIITSHSIESLSRREDLGSELSFSEGELIFKKMLTLFEKIKKIEIRALSHRQLGLINSYSTDVKDKISQIISFSAKGQTENPIQARTRILNEVENAYEHAYTNLTPILANELINSETLDEYLEKVKESIKAIESEKESYKEIAEGKLFDLEQILEASRSAAAEMGVTGYSRIFHEDSERFANTAKNWLSAVIISGLALIGWGFLALAIEPKDITNINSVIQTSLSKLIILTALVYLMHLSIRNYSANRHNSVLNRHRQNALQTFEAFVTAADKDPQTKNAVLLQATNCIFSNLSTGYIATTNDSDSQNKIIEIIKTVGKAGNP